MITDRNDDSTSGRRRNFLLTIVLLLWALNATARVMFGTMTITEGSLLDVEVTLMISQTITVMFFGLGIAGFIALPLLKINAVWGYQMIAAVSIATIVFDVWGLTIQFTAALGFIVPVMAMVYFAINPQLLREGTL